MDLYRYFHPHHNPRLNRTPIRLVELNELRQAVLELKKSVERAKIRTGNCPVGPIRDDHFSDMLVAVDYLVETLSTLCHAHPGDDSKTLESMIGERADAPGWENWTRLLEQRLELMRQYDDAPVPDEAATTSSHPKTDA
ncbi:MAG: hypothetical protein KDD44_06015 [Bdellovibrionales bacterium]|nr:hypothetical protein [Bdellovibrionales bacterium]